MVELDPDKRDWEYDGDGTKIYKLKAGKPFKTEIVDLDGGVPFKRDWVAESNENTKNINGD